ncbi:MAG: UDP-2,3-diacylglucosamine diphosphatase [Gammaproteobacteria bacterium]
MTHETLFISDLHLSFEKPEITRRFLHFLAHRACKAQTLYILGDLFDAWVGDDDNTPPIPRIKQHLQGLNAAGTSIYFQPGNRDFLLGEAFCADTGVTLLDDYAVIDLYGTPTLLMHGDLLCSDDLAYLAFRARSHTAEWRQNVLSKPLWLRLLAARWYRLRSLCHKRKKTAEIMDVNAQTVIDTLREYRVQRLIHGHTHRPGVHRCNVDGSKAERFVLAEWSKQSASVLCWDKQGFRLETLT